MAVHYLDLLLHSVSFVLAWLVVVYFYVARKRFTGKDFKKMVSWIFYGVIVLAVHTTIELVNTLTIHTHTTQYTTLVEGVHVMALLLFFKAAQVVYAFSKEYGFADVEKKVKKFFG